MNNLYTNIRLLLKEKSSFVPQNYAKLGDNLEICNIQGSYLRLLVINRMTFAYFSSRRISFQADSRFPYCCPASSDLHWHFCPDFVIESSDRPLCLLPSRRESRPSSRNPRPKISSPMSISHEPGESGVISAQKPRIIQIIPNNFFTFFFILLKVLQSS